jgi:hypothetical protein
MKLVILMSLLSIATSSFATDPIRVKGIVCEATKEVKGVKPFLIIKNISKSNATLMLDMNGGIPDIRNAVLDKVTNNGKLLVGYISEPSDINPYAPNFAVYTNGSNPQDTTKAELTFENKDLKIAMVCRDGMIPAKD